MITRLSEAFARPRPPWLNALLLCVAAAFGYTLCVRALILSDEGYLLLQAWDLVEGRVIYRDMDAFVTPGAWFLLGAAFAVFGPSVFVSRMVIFAAWLLLLVCTERLVSRNASRSAGLGATVCMALFTVWAFPAWTFAFYSPLAVLFALFALERLLAWWRGAGDRALFACGLLLGLSIVFKQNYGAFALAGSVVGFATMCLERRRQGALDVRGVLRPVGLTAAGVTAIGLPVLLYLAASGALEPAWLSLVVHPFEFAGAHDIPVAPLSAVFTDELMTDGVERLTYLSFAQLNTPPLPLLGAFRGAQRLHVLLYWLPLLVFVGGALLSVHARERRIDPVLASVTAVCGGVYLGLFPRADFNHLVNVYQVVIVAGAFVVRESAKRLTSRPAALRLAFALTVGSLIVVYALVALVWWNGLRTRLVVEIGGARGGVKVGRMDAENLGYMIRAVEQHSQPGEAVLTVPDLAMVNFLTNRPMPSAYYNLYEHHIAFDGGRAVVEGAERNRVPIALTRYNNFFSDRRGLLDYAPELADYLETRFRRSIHGGNDDYILLERRRTPIDKVPFTDAFARCEIGDEPPQQAELRHHLLFSALYHKSRPGHEMPVEGRTTRCAIDVPAEGGRLELEIGYRPPFKAEPRTQLDAVISVLDVVGETEVAREHFRVAAQAGKGPQMPYRRARVDLSPWAGQSVELVFHTTLRGRVQVHPLDFKGFAQVYRDARLIGGTDAAGTVDR